MVKRKGFTLTELLVVLVVASILIGLILPRAIKAVERANVEAHRSNLDTINESIMLCFTQERDFDLCDTEAELVDGQYIEKWPVQPFGGSYTIIDDPDGVSGKVASSSGSTDLPADINEDGTSI